MKSVTITSGTLNNHIPKRRFPMADTFQQKMDAFIETYCKKHHFSGSLRITVKDQILYQRFIGLADIEKHIALHEASMFTFYSLSKPFCALGLLKLKDKELVDIDSHPGRYVPQAQPFCETVTVRHMLHHISGLPDFEQNADFKAKYQPGLASKTREHLALLSGYPMVFTPGTQAMYANINFILCALIIENVTGMPYAQYMKQEVFIPLGMQTACIDSPELFVPNRVQGYTLENDQLLRIDRSVQWLLGAGDIIGTLNDVYCLNRAIKHGLLLTPDTWKEVLTPSPINSMGMPKRLRAKVYSCIRFTSLGSASKHR